MSQESRIAFIGAISGAIAGVIVAVLTGFFQYSTEQNKLEFERYKIIDERVYIQRKEMRELLAEYNVISDGLYSKIRTVDVQNTMPDLLALKKVTEQIKLMGNVPITNAVNHHSMALLDYFNQFMSSEGQKLHDKYINQSSNWTIVSRKYFET